MRNIENKCKYFSVAVIKTRAKKISEKKSEKNKENKTLLGYFWNIQEHF